MTLHCDHRQNLCTTRTDVWSTDGTIMTTCLVWCKAQVTWDKFLPSSLLSWITATQRSQAPSTYLCMVPMSTGRNKRRFPDKLSSVSEEMSHSARGNSDRALFDRLRLLSLQNLESHWETMREERTKTWISERDNQMIVKELFYLCNCRINK